MHAVHNSSSQPLFKLPWPEMTLLLKEIRIHHVKIGHFGIKIILAEGYEETVDMEGILCLPPLCLKAGQKFPPCEEVPPSSFPYQEEGNDSITRDDQTHITGDKI